MLYNNSYYNECYINLNDNPFNIPVKTINNIGEINYGKYSRIKKRSA